MSPKVLEVKNLATRFHTQDGIVHAVNGVSFDTEEGETLGIVGESGCGKSVSVLSVMRLLPQPPAEINAESVRFGGRELVDSSEEEMRNIRGSQIAMIFQDPMTSLNPVLTVGFQIMEPLRLHLGMTEGEAFDRAGELLHLVGIPEARDRLNDYPHQFSGGMRQRAMIAMALSCNPSLLIADEPTTALDVTIQAQIVDLVKRLRDQLGMSLIWITHDLGVVAGLADRVNVMYAGFIVETAAIDEVYGDPRHPYTFSLLKSLPRMDGSPGAKLESIEGLPPELLEMPVGCPFAPRCDYVKDICFERNPLLEEVANNHKIACWVDIQTGALR
ncbi:MAG: ATP-binding cassette domain-containing protein [Anaerolineales bacterium]|nr:ATP-binding cassette domain-containing protein [Anaerolineales bacterium]